MPEYHKPVLLDETISFLDPKESGVYLDATLGGGGHSSAILERIGPKGILIGIDRDQEAIEHTGERLKQYGDSVKLVRGNFRDLASILDSLGIKELDGAIFDLGVSSHQLDSARGFSFLRDEPLDMRMSGLEEDTSNAAEIVNNLNEHNLADLIWRYGEERFSRRIAGAIVTRRQKKQITSTGELAEIVTSAIPAKNRWGQDIHPATRTFQAIRIAVNKELEAAESGIPAAIEALKIGARIAVISFHSLEDRIVKTTFRRYAGYCECPPRLPMCACGAQELIRIITKKPITPSEDEVKANPRSRSSRLRVGERIH